MTKLETCTCLSLYDLDPFHTQKSENMKELFFFLEKWFNEQGWPPMRMSVSGNEIPSTTQTKTFKYYKKLIEKIDFRGIDDFWIGATPPNHSIDIFDAFISCDIDLVPPKLIFTLYFHNNIINKNWIFVENIVKTLSQWIKFGYGIAYQRDFNKGPGLYGHGIISGLSIKQDPLIQMEKNNISKWSHIYGDPKRYHHGDLRDIYPLNFLSKEHLERLVGDTTLKIWIESSPDHGTLVPLTDQLWSWSVPEDQISSVREALRPTGFVLCI